MGDEEGRVNTRSHSRKDLDTYFKSDAFGDLVNKAITQQFQSFLSSKGFQDMLVLTTKTIVSEVVCDTVESVVDKEIDKVVQPLKNKIAELEVQLDQVKSHANDNEQYSKRCNVRIYGIPEEKGENCYDAVVNFCRNCLKCDVAVSEIDRTHRVGKQRNDSTPRAMIVKFLSYQSKLKVLKHRRNLKGSKKFINEDLTLVNKILFDSARRDLFNLSVWTTDGKVLVKMADEKIVRIKSKEDICSLK